MIEKSTFDKNGIKRHEVASSNICDIQTGLSEEINEAWGQSLTDDLDIFPTTNNANTLSMVVLTSMAFSYFLTSKSRI